MNKRVILVLTLCLISCSIYPLPTPTSEVNYLRNVFEIRKECPNICWMNIIPETTTMEDAISILRASAMIDQDSIQKLGLIIHANWKLDKDLSYLTGVKITGNNRQIVQSIEFIQLHPVKLNDFIVLLGEPDEISIVIKDVADARYIVTAIYYLQYNLIIYINPKGDLSGPDPNDSVGGLYVNPNFDNNSLYPWVIDDYSKRQPWLGYGSLEEYMLKIRIPPNP